MLLEPILLGVVTAVVAGLLVWTAKRYPLQQDQVVTAINNCLPQTQCAQCGHPGCLPYAKAIALGEPINRCPPGGEETITALADLLGREVTSLDPEFGELENKKIARIRESECIGCTLCIQACPVDAIVGASQLMHSVIEDKCTGCDLCLPPCPVDCIDLVDITNTPTETLEYKAPTTLGLTTETECIRCGDCESICPKALQPQALYWQRSSTDAMQSLALDECIECRLCDRVCPSAIPLTQHFKQAKVRLRAAEEAKLAATTAEARYHNREQRLATQSLKTNASADDRKALLDRLAK